MGDFYILPVILEDKRLEILIAVNSDFSPGENPIKTGSITHDHSTSIGNNSGARVLIVDDSRMSRRMLRNILESGGFQVVGEAENGVNGVKAYQALRPDAVTLDITMPEMDGLTALEEILKLDPHANACMITAAGQQDKLIRALRAGAKRFISKPFNEEEILRNIREVLTAK
ncbi:MAG: response regulator [Lachnospiraceae bacterium]|nr:response regulator [Lachnospiraceae bacterium]